MDDWEVRRVAVFGARDAAVRTSSAETRSSHVRVRRGIYVDNSDWAEKEREARHFVRMQTVSASMRSAPVFSHQSAALIWGLPVVGVPLQVQLIAAGRVGVRSQRGIRWHNDALRDSEIAEVGGFLVTNLERTLVDLARACTFPSAVAALDAGIRTSFESPVAGRVRGVEPARLGELVNAAARRRGVRAARRAVAFADARSGSAGESVSRANLHLLGFPAPELQVPFRRDDGGFDIVDFDWPALGRFGEFDGRGKYLRDEYTAERTIEEIVLAEKDREDRIRRHRPLGVRWGWDVALEPMKLHRHMVMHGFHPAG
ncbi:hypothetical protein [Agromyces bauzanensis]|uniref:Transcriptional regulator, AbiEi antitoxin, Type IV TA system n=1 Tax=Agromyces bauzanensis TaxID=1308924 RepID=A0A917PMD7_9MICO|nr:hypothetical protein [Agromyces bauzanensis]GGJ84227.1 hypothetical protein GCM10011372_23150 [Agromyces bauzanensis]